MERDGQIREVLMGGDLAAGPQASRRSQGSVALLKDLGHVAAEI